MVELYGDKSLWLKINHQLSLFGRRKKFLVSDWFYSGYKQEIISKGLDR